MDTNQKFAINGYRDFSIQSILEYLPKFLFHNEWYMFKEFMR